MALKGAFERKKKRFQKRVDPPPGAGDTLSSDPDQCQQKGEEEHASDW